MANTPLEGDSTSGTTPGVKGVNTATSGNGHGVFGTSANWEGVHGDTNSATAAGVVGIQLNPAGTGAGVFGGNDGKGHGVFGTSANWEGVHGETNSTTAGGVAGVQLNPNGTGAGVFGQNDGKGHGVFGTSANWEGVHGDTNSTTAAGVVGVQLNPNGTGAGVFGGNDGKGHGVFGTSANWEGVHGETNSTTAGGVAGIQLNPNGTGAGVYGESRGKGPAGFFKGDVMVFGTVNADNPNGRALQGNSQTQDAIQGTSAAPTHAGVSAVNTGDGFGLWAKAKTAGHFEGDVQVTGTITVDGDVVLTNQDCAEDFDIELCANIEPGTVMALSEHGLLQESQHAYDKKVAGVISGAGKFKPGLILGREKGQNDNHRAAVALTGKVYCKVDAQFGEISVGDLLTTSATPGHAMKAADPLKAFGSVIGKALQSMSAGKKGLIPILVALQ
jgi:hypothetical protein